MTILVDLDGVICTEEMTFERSLARPVPGAREALESLAAEGHTIVIYTARSWSELKMTQKWLDDHGIPYHGLHMGKPVADRIIDDRALKFTDWGQMVEQLLAPHQKYVGGPVDEALLRSLRQHTKLFLEEIAARPDLLDPVVEIGAMALEGDGSGVFRRMADTFVDSRALFEGTGKKYLNVDIDASSKPDIVADFAKLESVFRPQTVGTMIMMSCLEHMPDIWNAPRILSNVLQPGGRAFFLTPWNLRFHGPRPDCWRISDDGYQALFSDLFVIEDLYKIECPGRPLSPIGIKCVIRKK